MCPSQNICLPLVQSVYITQGYWSVYIVKYYTNILLLVATGVLLLLFRFGMSNILYIMCIFWTEKTTPLHTRVFLPIESHGKCQHVTADYQPFPFLSHMLWSSVLCHALMYMHKGLYG